MAPTDRARVPPGQTSTRSFPVLHTGEVPRFDATTWDLRVGGLVERALRFTWDEFRALPRVLREADFHAASGWSRLRNRWEGVLLRDVLGRAGVRREAKFVRFADGDSYDTSVPIESALDDDVLLADTHDGRPLDPTHGGPLRVVVPKRYSFKSCKWVRAVECLATDRAGFWESRGVHPNADPWREERRAASAAAAPR